MVLIAVAVLNLAIGGFIGYRWAVYIYSLALCDLLEAGYLDGSALDKGPEQVKREAERSRKAVRDFMGREQ